MTARTADPFAAAYTATVLARTLDRAGRGVTICACGAEYHNDAGGRRVRRVLFEHTPTRDAGGAE